LKDAKKDMAASARWGPGDIERACGPAAVRRAIEHYDQALTVSREIGDRRNEGASLDNLGLPHAELNMTARVLDLWQEALRIFEEIESPHTETVRGSLANIE
jgi:hypothetical protein